MQTKSWYRSWFDSPYYHVLYQGRDDKEAEFFIDRLIDYLNPSQNSLFLDMACGRGRHSLQIHQKGYSVVGIDLSESNISEAKKHEETGLEFDVHDMRETFRTNTFEYVLNLFTSFGYFSSREQNLNVLETAFTALKSGGILILDFLNPLPVKNAIKKNEELKIDGIHFNINRDYDNGWITKKIEITDGENQYNFEEKVWAIDHEEFKAMLSQSGFNLIDTFGSYNLDGYNTEVSDRQILIAKKP